MTKTKSVRLTRTIRDYLLWLRRWFWILPLTTIAGFLLGQYIVSVTPSSYKSWAVIEIDRTKQEAQGVDEEEKFRIGGLGELMSTIEKLKMPNLYNAVAQSSHIENIRSEGDHNLLPDRRELLPWKQADKRRTTDVPADILARAMPGWVTLSWRENTDLIDIWVTHTDPKVAQATARGILSEYERLKEESVTGSSRHALEYLLKEAKATRGKILARENAAQLYNRCIELKVHIRQAEDEIVILEKRYLPKWPPLIEANDLLQVLRRQFLAELKLVQESAEGEEKDYWTHREELLASLDESGRTDQLLRLVESRSSILEREIETEKSLYTSLMTKWNEGTLSEGYTTTEFSVAQEPTLPTGAVAPIRSSIIRNYTLRGLLAGIGVILLLGFLDPTVRTVEDIERLSQLEVIGAFPLIKGATRKSDAESTGLYPGIPKGNPMAEETIRTLRAGLSFLGDKEERQSFLFTSAVPAEGKSWVSSNLAVAFALQEEKTLVIDFDLRKPVQHTIFQVEKDHPGVTDFLSQGKTFEEVLQKPEAAPDDLFLISAGGSTPNPAELLTSRNVERIINDASACFDRIILDTPPVLSVRDALVLAKLAQSVVLVFRTGKTHAGALTRALGILEANQTTPVGIAANCLRGKSANTYGYYYSYGNKSYERYYAKNEM